jgi:ATP-binding cassette subfamily B protein
MAAFRLARLGQTDLVRLAALSGLWEAERRGMFAAMAAVAGYTAAQIAIPLMVSTALDSLGARRSGAFELALGGLLIACAVNACASTVENVAVLRLAQRVVHRLRRALFTHLHRVELGFYGRHSTAQIMSRFHTDLALVEQALLSSANAFGNVLMVIGVFVAIAWSSPALALLVAGALGLLGVANAACASGAAKSLRLALAAQGETQAAVADNVLGVQAVQDCRREDLNLGKFKKIAERGARLQVRAALSSQARTVFGDLATGLATAAVVLVGGLSALHGDLRPGVLVAFLLLVRRLFDPIRALSQQVSLVQRLTAAAARLVELLGSDVSRAGGSLRVASGDPVATVRFQNVTFGYDRQHAVLDGLTFEAGEQRSVALVGATGAGKTTVASLMLRLYEPWSGTIQVGGRDVREYSRGALADIVGLVTQEPILFSGTVRDNILCGRAISDARAAEAVAEVVQAYDFISRLPNGFDTMLAPDTRLLSMGQRQLLNLARVLVSNPKILILDEATSNIDSFTELKLQNCLRDILQHRTSIIIAHRLATTRSADEILVLSGGRIVERGSHTELLNQGRAYKRFAEQAFTIPSHRPVD